MNFEQIESMSKQELADELKLVKEEYEIIMESARNILNRQELKETASEIISLCKKITGATAGYVSLFSSCGLKNEILFLDSNEFKFTMNNDLPLPIKDLLDKAFTSNKEHVQIDNMMFSPLSVDKELVGLIGLANKKGGFTKKDTNLITMLADIAAVALRNSKNLESVQYLSYHDQLTGLYNRHYFVQELERIENSNKYPITIISADVDGLKNINDTLGHECGDLYLKDCARILRESLRERNLLARVGGDEFVIVLPFSDQKQGEKIIEEIKQKIENYNETKTQNSIPLMISMGLAVSENKSKSLKETSCEADKIMYENKFQRKNSNDKIKMAF